jgi:hypothetical protein
MTSAKHMLLGCSHIAVLGLGLWLGMRGTPEPDTEENRQTMDAASLSTSPIPSPGMPSRVSDSDTPKFSSRDYAAAWDTLKSRLLPKQERLILAKALLQEWSVIDLEAAVRAVFAETSDEGPGQIGISALALRLLGETDTEWILKVLQLLPAEVQGEVGAASLRHGAENEHHALFLANIALDSGNLDALQAAAASPGFARFVSGIEQPLPLLRWALRLPEDPRTLEIFRQSVEGAASGDYEAVRAEIEALPPGWHRERGLAVLSKPGIPTGSEGE